MSPLPMEQETDVNTRNSSFRLSRISNPRATFWAMILLALVFLCFGLVAQAYVPEIHPAGAAFEGFGAGVSSLPSIPICGN